LKVLTEVETLNMALDGRSLARFGDGELRLAVDGSCSSQKADPKLAHELRNILAGTCDALPCIPSFEHTPRKDVWDKYAKPPFARLYQDDFVYGSSFITRPDNAPWIDTPEYWESVRCLWKDRDVILVTGIATLDLHEAESVLHIHGPAQDAYDQIDKIEEIIGRPNIPVLLSLGATATVLAARLSDKGVHALDLGHIWHFMSHAGAFRFESKDLRSKAYANQLHAKHRTGKWGRSGHSHLREVMDWAYIIGARSVLDYGCGQGTLREHVAREFSADIMRVSEYDPGIRGKDHLPKPAQMIVCTDVLEHIEPDLIDNVLKHQFALAERGAYFMIALTPARELLPDGRNAHLLLRDVQWWLDSLMEVGWTIERHEKRKGLAVWCRK
jgi:hypothetical protein